MKGWKTASIFLLALIGLIIAGCGGGGGGGSIALIPTHSISGSVTSGGVALQGATVTLSGARSATTTTDVNGKYTFAGLPNGNYTVKPSMSGKLCNPKFSTQTVNGADIPSVDFTTTNSSINLLVVDDQGNLGNVNITNGTVQVIGKTRDASGNTIYLTDIAVDPSGNLYGNNTDSLYRIDKNTAVATLIGKLNINSGTSLVFDDNGVLYTADTSLYTVNANTGAATRIGNGGYYYVSSGDLAFLVNQMYLTSQNISTPDTNDLVKLDPTTGQGTYVGNIGFPKVYGMATNDSVNLYGVSGTKLIKIDPNTGKGSLLYDYTGNVQGLGNGNGVVFN
jgi:hypothetical protein